MTILDGAREFFSAIAEQPDAARHLAPYPELSVHLLLPSERIVVEAATGVARALDGDACAGFWGVELEAREEVFASLFDCERTLGEAIYAGALFVPEEKSKHNLVAALGQAIRIGQESRRRR